MNMTLILAIGCGVVIFLLVTGVIALLRASSDEADDKVRNRLRQLALTEVESESIDLVLKQSSMSGVPLFNRMLEQARFAKNLTRTIKQADAKGTAGVYLLVCTLLGLIGLLLGIVLIGKPVIGLVLAGGLGYLPIMHLTRLKKKRMDRFQKQFPDALDLMSRALKAGHTFSGAMRMVADEFDNPISGEFRTTLEEINFGVDVDRALANLQDRVDIGDLKFFIVSVNIQRETGGNLAEIISNIARLVRERFILFGKIKVLSAEGRISALLLSALPFVIAIAIYCLNPEYMSLLWTTETGQGMAWGAIFSMAVGIVSMRRMVNIKV